ncbi:hypothetical protein FQN54_006328 [Arachnomyces sp. PD_36]|nr:hypothetical protein FQN54_006328 [Arachnomyces sp. PD_36]
MTTSLPQITTLPSLPPSSQSSLLSTLFEPSPHLLPLLSPILLTSPPFESYTSLINAIRTRLHTLTSSATTSAEDKEALDSILSSHPRLGAKQDSEAKVGMSDLSKTEQRNLGSEQEREELRRLNGEYEGRFGGLRVFVNGRGRDVIMEDMKRRIERGDVELERREAVDAMCDIALDRVRKLSEE